MRVVIDTNVLISAFLSPGGTPAQILQAWRRQQVEVVVSADLLTEYAETLASPKINRILGLSSAEIEEIIQSLKASAIFLPIILLEVQIAKDPDDNILFAAAIEGQADYIISGDGVVQAVKEYQGIRVFSPGLFLTLLEQRV